MTWPGSWISLPLTPRRAATARTWAWDSSEGMAPWSMAASRMQRVRIAGADVVDLVEVDAVVGPGSFVRLERERLDEVHVVAQLVAGPGQRLRDPRAELALEHRHHAVPHPRPGEAGIGVVRVLPAGDALGPAGRLGLGPGQAEQRAGEPTVTSDRGSSPASPATTGHRSPAPARAARSPPGRRACGPAAPAGTGSAAASWARAAYLASRAPASSPRTRGRRSPGSTRSRRRRAPPSARPPSPCARPSPPAGRGRR